jgi:hypothetical protein
MEPFKAELLIRWGTRTHGVSSIQRLFRNGSGPYDGANPLWVGINLQQKGGEKMRKWVVIGHFLVAALLMGGHTMAWQGRMAGMDDPYGLVSDESDLLIHPAKIAGGKGIRQYNHYRFTYTMDSEWSWHADLDGGLIALIPTLSLSYDLDMDGDVQSHDALVGLAFPLGPGRMGVFFEYGGRYGDYDGDSTLRAGAFGGSASIDFDNEVDTDLNDFALRVVYGLPLGSARLGLEAKLAYRTEENAWTNDLTDVSITGVAVPPLSLTLTDFPLTGLNQFLYPYDSDYWDLSFKAGLGWVVGGVEFDLTPRVGFILGGDNNWDSDVEFKLKNVAPFTIKATNDFDMDGDVEGWNLGLDFWIRVPVSDSISMPFLFRVDYSEKERDGSGDGDFEIGFLGLKVPLDWDHESQEDRLRIDAGLGLDINASKSTKIALGLYYSYLQSETDLMVRFGIPVLGGFEIDSDTDGYPESREHRVTFKFAGEHGVSPSFALRWGFHAFYGSVEEEYNSDIGINVLGVGLPRIFQNDVCLDGDHWGFGATLGATAKFNSFTLEPFLQGGYHKVSLDGDQDWDILGLRIATFDIEKERSEWFLGGGFSVLFDL